MGLGAGPEGQGSRTAIRPYWVGTSCLGEMIYSAEMRSEAHTHAIMSGPIFIHSLRSGSGTASAILWEEVSCKRSVMHFRMASRKPGKLGHLHSCLDVQE